MFKYLGQHIFDFVSKFRNDVYFQNLEELDQNFSIVVGPDGKLSKSKSPAEKSIIEVRNDEGSVIPAGAPLYSKGEIGGSDRIKVGICDASDPAKMPCIGIAQAEMNTSDTKDNFAITQGVYNTNISGFTGLSEGDTLYVNGGSAPYLVSTKPSNGNYIQNVGIVLKTNGTICQGLLVSAIGRTNDVPWPLYVDVPNSRVGIGTTTPSAKLDVVGNIKIGADQNIFSDGSITIGIDYNNNQTDRVFNIVANNSTEVFRVQEDGKVGIGTTSPNAVLDVQGSKIHLGTGGSNTNRAFFIANTTTNTFEFNNSVGDRGIRILTNSGSVGGSAASRLYGAAGGVLLEGANGQENIALTTDGKVGIGTTSPTEKLEVSGTIKVNTENSQIALYRGDGATLIGRLSYSGTTLRIQGNDGIRFEDTNGSTIHGIITDSGNYGIGTTSPSEKLHINGNAKVQGNIYLNDATERYIYGYNNLSYIKFYDPSYGGMLLHTHPNHTLRVETNLLEVTGGFSTGGDFTMNGDLSIGNGNKIQSSSGNNYIHLYRGSDASMVFKITHPTVGHYIWLDKDDNELVRFTRDGKVGIGTTSPTDKLDVSGNLKLVNTQDYIKFANDFVTIKRDGANFMSLNAYAGFKFYDTQASSERMRITSGGQLLLNGTTTSFSDKLYINGDAYVNGAWRVGTSTTYVGKLYNTSGILTLESDSTRDIQFGSVTNGTAMFIEGTNGNVGIGTTTPSEKLDVTGNIKASGTIKGKMEQMFACSFSDDLGTTKHYLSFTSNAEQTNVHADQAAMVMPYNGRVKAIQLRLSNIDADTIRTFGIETIATGINMYASSNNWTIEETESYELLATDDFYLVNYVFSNTNHFESGDLLAISIQDTEDAYTASRQTYVNVIIEYDLNNGMGNDTATTKYTS